jgi:hypothetical protein
MVRIPNTLHLEYLYVSENLVDEALQNDDVEVAEEASELQFDEDGNLPSFGTGGSGHLTRAAPGPDDGYFVAS